MNRVLFSCLALFFAFLHGCNNESPSNAQQSASRSRKQKNSTAENSTAANQTVVEPTAEPAPTDLKTLDAAVSLTDESINTCRKICSKSDTCEKSKQRSFCKWDQESPSCFGLAWESEAHSAVCFTKDGSCKGDHPVKCGIVDSRNPGHIGTVDFLTVQDRINSCQGLCSFAQGCEKSVCTDSGKTKFPICSYLYWDNRGKELSPTTVSYEIDHANAMKNGKVPVECGIFDYATSKRLEHKTANSSEIQT